MNIDIDLKVCKHHPLRTKKSHSLAFTQFNLAIGLTRENMYFVDLTLQDASFRRAAQFGGPHFSMIPLGITRTFIERVPETYVLAHSLSSVDAPAYAQVVFTALCSFGNPFGDEIEPDLMLYSVSQLIKDNPRDIVWAKPLSVRVVSVARGVSLQCI